MNVHNLSQMKKERRFSSLQPVGGAMETDLVRLQQVNQGRLKKKKKSRTHQSLRFASDKARTLASPVPAGGAMCLVYLYKSDRPLCEGRKGIYC